MFCPRCGGEIPDTATFCPHCGAEIPRRRAVARRRGSGVVSSPAAIRMAYAGVCGAVAAMLLVILLAGGFVAGTNGTLVDGSDGSLSLLSLCVTLLAGGSMGNPTMVSLSLGILLLTTAGGAVVSWAVQCALTVARRRSRLVWCLSVAAVVMFVAECMGYVGFAWCLTPWVAWNGDYAVLPQASVAYLWVVPELALLVVLLVAGVLLRRLEADGSAGVRVPQVLSLVEAALTSVGAVTITGLAFCAPVLDVATGGTVIMGMAEVIGLLAPRSWVLWVPIALLCLVLLALYLVLCIGQVRDALSGGGAVWPVAPAVLGAALVILLVGVIVLGNAFLAQSAGVALSPGSSFSPIAPSPYWVVEGLVGVGALVGAAVLGKRSQRERAGRRSRRG